LHRIVKLPTGFVATSDGNAVAQPPVDVLRKLDVLRRVRRVPVVEADVEARRCFGRVAAILATSACGVMPRRRP